MPRQNARANLHYRIRPFLVHPCFLHMTLHGKRLQKKARREFGGTDHLTAKATNRPTNNRTTFSGHHFHHFHLPHPLHPLHPSHPSHLPLPPLPKAVFTYFYLFAGFLAFWLLFFYLPIFLARVSTYPVFPTSKPSNPTFLIPYFPTFLPSKLLQLPTPQSTFLTAMAIGYTYYPILKKAGILVTIRYLKHRGILYPKEDIFRENYVSYARGWAIIYEGRERRYPEIETRGRKKLISLEQIQAMEKILWDSRF